MTVAPDDGEAATSLCIDRTRGAQRRPAGGLISPTDATPAGIKRVARVRQPEHPGLGSQGLARLSVQAPRVK